MHLVLDLLHLSQALATLFRPAGNVSPCVGCSGLLIDCPAALRLGSGGDDKDSLVAVWLAITRNTERPPDCSGLFRGYIAFNVGQENTELVNLRQPRILLLAVRIS